MFKAEEGDKKGVTISNVVSDVELKITAGRGRGETRVVIVTIDEQFNSDKGEFETVTRQRPPIQIRSRRSKVVRLKVPKSMSNTTSRSVSIVAVSDSLPIEVEGTFSVVSRRTLLADGSQYDSGSQ